MEIISIKNLVYDCNLLDFDDFELLTNYKLDEIIYV